MHDNFQSNFANRLIKLRMAKGVSAREMSLSLGQSEGYIAQIERKHNLPSMMVFTYICDYLGITEKDFFDDGQENPEYLNRLIEKLKTFNKEELASVMGVVDIISKSKS